MSGALNRNENHPDNADDGGKEDGETVGLGCFEFEDPTGQGGKDQLEWSDQGFVSASMKEGYVAGHRST